MKLIFVLVATLIAFSAQANDRKLGNVIAIERQVTGLYDSCLSNVTSDITTEQSFFICNISYLKSPLEVSATKNGAIRFADNNCAVNADAANGFLIMTFGKATGSSDFATAKSCLQQALKNNNSVDVLVYSVE